MGPYPLPSRADVKRMLHASLKLTGLSESSRLTLIESVSEYVESYIQSRWIQRNDTSRMRVRRTMKEIVSTSDRLSNMLTKLNADDWVSIDDEMARAFDGFDEHNKDAVVRFEPPWEGAFEAFSAHLAPSARISLGDIVMALPTLSLSLERILGREDDVPRGRPKDEMFWRLINNVLIEYEAISGDIVSRSLNRDHPPVDLLHSVLGITHHERKFTYEQIDGFIRWFQQWHADIARESGSSNDKK